MWKLCVAVSMTVASVASAQPSAKPPSVTLERGTKLYEKADYDSASVEFTKVVDARRAVTVGS